MLVQNHYQFEDMETLKTMYNWLRSGYKQIEERLAKAQEENAHLRAQLNKNIHPFID